MTDSEDQVLLASEPNWRKKTLPTCSRAGPDPSRVRQAIRDARRSFGAPAYVYIAGTPLPRRRGAGRLPQLAADLLRHARGRARPGERGPVADHHGAGAAARARLLPAVAPHPRREPAHPARIRGAAGAEPAALRRDRRAKARREEPQGGRAEPRAGVEARRPRPDVGGGQPRAEPAARGDEDLSRRRAAAADPPAARGGAVLVPAHRRPDRPHGRHHPPAQVLRPQGRRRHRAGRPARQRARGAVDDGAAARQDVGEAS